jgi:hypothetical protein
VATTECGFQPEIQKISGLLLFRTTLAISHYSDASTSWAKGWLLYSIDEVASFDGNQGQLASSANYLRNTMTTKSRKIQALISGLAVFATLASCTNNLSATALNGSRFLKENPQVLTQIGKVLSSRSNF